MGGNYYVWYIKYPSFFRCHEILSKFGVNLKQILVKNTKDVFDDNTNVMVSITAIQLALVDLLSSLDIKSNNYIGYSIGEIACAYQDQCLSLEQAILCSYHISDVTKTKKSPQDLLKILKKIIPSPKPRSPKWESTMEDPGRVCSPEYFIQTLNSSITLKSPLPKNAIVLEISPGDILQKVLTEVVDNGVTVMSFAQKDQDNIGILTRTLGQLYLAGYNSRIEELYPSIQWPVSRGTPMLSHLMKWDHKDDWYVTKFEAQEKIKSGERTITVLLSDEDVEFVGGHVIDG